MASALINPRKLICHPTAKAALDSEIVVKTLDVEMSILDSFSSVDFDETGLYSYVIFNTRSTEIYWTWEKFEKLYRAALNNIKRRNSEMLRTMENLLENC